MTPCHQTMGGEHGQVRLFLGAPGERQPFAAALAALRNKRERTQGIAVIVGWVARMGVPLQDRADVAQDALRRATESWPTFRADYPTGTHAQGPASAGAEGAASEPGARAKPPGVPPMLFLRWLNSVTRHAVWHYYDRAVHKHEELAEEPVDPETPDPAPGAAESFAREQERLSVLDALQALPQYERAVLIAHDIDGISMEEIAEHLRIPTSTAYTVHARARVALGKEIERRETEEREADERHNFPRTAPPRGMPATNTPKPVAPESSTCGSARAWGHPLNRDVITTIRSPARSRLLARCR
jgi:DNA-directed RNA polymerase specialized sigma24 family protein